jgi:hypothetical protein
MSDVDTKHSPAKPEAASQTPEVIEACKLAQEIGAKIGTQFGSVLTPRARQKVVTAFRRTLFPAKSPGRRRKEAITAAHRDWKGGMRGVDLYKAHIPGWQKHNHWRREGEARRLMDAIQSRERLDRKGGRPRTGNVKQA